METVWLIVCILGAWIFIGRAIEPERALKWDLDYRLFFRDSEPTPQYFRMVRIVSIALAALAILVAVGILWETFGK